MYTCSPPTNIVNFYPPSNFRGENTVRRTHGVIVVSEFSHAKGFKRFYSHTHTYTHTYARELPLFHVLGRRKFACKRITAISVKIYRVGPRVFETRTRTRLSGKRSFGVFRHALASIANFGIPSGRLTIKHDRLYFCFLRDLIATHR